MEEFWASSGEHIEVSLLQPFRPFASDGVRLSSLEDGQYAFVWIKIAAARGGLSGVSYFSRFLMICIRFRCAGKLFLGL